MLLHNQHSHLQLHEKLFHTCLTGLEFATNTVASELFPFAAKITGEVAKCNLFSPSLFQKKRVSSCYFAATFAKINK